MKTVRFTINLWELNPEYYEFIVDGEKHLTKIPKGQLRTIFNEMEKFCRLRFKGELKHESKIKC